MNVYAEVGLFLLFVIVAVVINNHLHHQLARRRNGNVQFVAGSKWKLNSSITAVMRNPMAVNVVIKSSDHGVVRYDFCGSWPSPVDLILDGEMFKRVYEPIAEG